VIPFSSEKIWKMLNLGGDVHMQSWNDASELLVPEGLKLGKTEILFTKIEDSVIEAELNSVGGSQSAAPAPQPKQPEPKPAITIDDFKKVDLRIAKVIHCENVPKSEKLLKLQVEVGTEKRQIVAGIAQHYKPEDVVGKSIVIVYNLQPAKLMGQESQGMLLAASNDVGKLVFVSPSAEIESGSVVK
jgi:methionyl-tRNA synthetase